jgi:hypothetical protein
MAEKPAMVGSEPGSSQQVQQQPQQQASTAPAAQQPVQAGGEKKFQWGRTQ